MKKNKFKKNYPYIVVPLNESEKEKADGKGIKDTFCANIDIATEVKTRLDWYSGVLWRIKQTEDETLNWNI